MISQTVLEEAGYTRFLSPQNLYTYSDFFYQKAITDASGTKYYIDFVHYSAQHQMKESWMLTFRTNEPVYTFQYHYCGHNKLEDLEKLAHDVWEILGSPYYEKNEESPKPPERKRLSELAENGYEILEVGAMLQRGDQVRWDGKWIDVIWHFKCGFYSVWYPSGTDCTEVYYRRRQ